MQKQLAFMLGRQQVFLELNENMVEYDDLVEIMSNAHLNNHFLNLAREVSCIVFSMLISGQIISVSTPLYWYNLGCGFSDDLFSSAYVLKHTNQQMYRDQLEGACSMCGNNERCIMDFAWKN